MATFTASISGSALVNGSKNWTLSDADLQSIINWARAVYPVPIGSPPLTDGQALTTWMQSMLDTTKAQVTQWVRSQQATAPITFT